MSFSVNIGTWGKNTKDKISRVRRATIIKLFSAVILDSPVLSGRLRGNWRIAVNAIDLTTVDITDPTGQATIREVEETVSKLGGDESVSLANSLPYAARIEFEGWSHTKAPEGMVRKNVARFNQLLEAEAKK